MKAVLISIRPKWCEKIASGEKTIEVRKTRPKLQTPFKCYIYCTQASVKYQTICGCQVLNSDELYRHPEQGIKHGDSIELMLCENYTKDNFLNGKVIGEFTCDEITRVNICGFWDDSGKQLDNRLKETCLTTEEFCNYLGENVGCGWHISNLKIYDKPRELREFTGLRQTKFGAEPVPITRPPQSWCYVEEQRKEDSRNDSV